MTATGERESELEAEVGSLRATVQRQDQLLAKYGEVAPDGVPTVFKKYSLLQFEHKTLLSSLVWTNEPPKREGNYYHRYAPGAGAGVVLVTSSGLEWWVYQHLSRDGEEFGEFLKKRPASQWAGPIQFPLDPPLRLCDLCRQPIRPGDKTWKGHAHEGCAADHFREEDEAFRMAAEHDASPQQGGPTTDVF